MIANLLSSIAAWHITRCSKEWRLWTDEANRCALLAHGIDPMREPLRWGRLQNRVNWCRRNARRAIEQRAEIRAKRTPA